ncbi:TRAP transporter small permease [Microbaculum marinum]|uniref:TRAP transporter small permease protein n=1 Tax=Microbaculum marinum TaxID=1764581 RepID=A0AAW9RWQ0_9HYPH
MRSVRLEGVYRTVTTALAILAGIILCAIALAIPVDVTLRACCSSAIFGLGDLTEHGIAAATFLGAPWVLCKNAHVAVDIFVNRLSEQSRNRLDVIVNLIGAAVSAVFFWYVLQALIIAASRGSMVRGIIVVPEWLTFLSPTVSGALLAIGFLLRIGVSARTCHAPGL